MRTPRWLPYAGIIAFYITLIVIVRLWMRPVYAERHESARSETMRRWAAIHERVVMENERLREVTIRDSLERVLPRTPGVYIDSINDTVSVPTADDTSAPLSLRDLALRETGSAPLVVIAVVAIPPRYGGHPEVREGVWRRTFLSGFVGGQPYCVVALPSQRNRIQRHDLTLLTRRGMLGPCRFWSRYGAPGAGIRQWLDHGGAHFAGSDEVYDTWDDADKLAVPEAREVRSRFLMPLAGQACLAGNREVCVAAVANPLRAYGQADSVAPLNEWDVRLMTAERSLLGRLERDFGAVRFQRFWSSSAPFEGAFRDAFGVEPGEWIHEWMRPLGPIERGARLGGGSILLTVLFLGVCTGLVMATAHRRRV